MDDAEFKRAERARDALAAEILGRPEVSMIDIGADQVDGAAVVRVHLRDEGALDEGALGDNIPAAVGGVRVQVVRGAYRPEGHADESIGS
jgi:hypothetical protein